MHGNVKYALHAAIDKTVNPIYYNQGPLLLTRFMFNPSMDK